MHSYIELARMVIRLTDAGMRLSKAIQTVSDAYSIDVPYLTKWVTEYRKGE